MTVDDTAQFIFLFSLTFIAHIILTFIGYILAHRKFDKLRLIVINENKTYQCIVLESILALKLYSIHAFSFPIKQNAQYLHCGGDTLIPLSTHFVTKSQLMFIKVLSYL